MATGTVTMQSSAAAVDGYVAREGVTDAWATIIAGAGTSAAYSPDTGYSMMITSHTVSGQWVRVRRMVFMFVPATMPVGATIIGGSLTIYPKAADARNFGSSFMLIEAPVTAPTSLINADYALLHAVTTEAATNRVALADIVAGVPIIFTLTAQTLNDFQALYAASTPYKLAMLFDWDFDGASPTWVSSKSDDITIAMSEAGSPTWPVLSLTYETAASVATISLTGTKASAGDTLTADMWAVEVFT